MLYRKLGADDDDDDDDDSAAEYGRDPKDAAVEAEEAKTIVARENLMMMD